MNTRLLKIIKVLKSLVLVTLVILSLDFFLRLTQYVWSKDYVINIDQTIATYIYSLRTPFITDIMMFITSLADVNTIIVLFVFVVAILLVLKKRSHIIPVVFTLLGNLIFVSLVKTILARPRPLLANALVYEESYSYPSGHSLIAITIYGLLIIYLFTFVKSHAIRRLSVIVGVILILTVGFSRIYLGAHWPSDVLASYLIGICWLSLILFLIEHRERILKILNINNIKK